jgi:hypothetical protein
LSAVFPYACAEAPQELLPIIPPSEQWLWVAGFGPNRSRCADSRRFNSSSTMPGSTTQVR